MFVDPSTCEMFATFESSSGRFRLAAVGEAYVPEDARVAVGARGVVWSAWIESLRTCGVWIATGYWTPVFGSSQKFGVVCALDESEMSRALATSRAVSPTS